MGPLDRARVDQVGSLLRPDALKVAFAAHQEGRLEDTALSAAQDEAVRAVVADEERHGVPILTDGEYRRANFQDSLASSIAGFEAWRDRWRNRPIAGTAPRRATLITRHRVTERLRLLRDVPLEEWRFTSLLTDRPVKVTLIGPDIAGIDGVTFGIHLCRGNERSMWHREGPYDEIAERLFSGLAHARLLLEYDTDRAGTFAPLRFVGRDKVVVLGLVTTKTAVVEDADDLVRRIEEAARYVPVERLALSPQCGFASDIAGNLLSADAQWRKLELVREVARRVWG
jgi:methionine synthase II (cobalamin-independent)